MDLPNPVNFSENPDRYADRFNKPDEWERYKRELENWRRCYYAMVSWQDELVGQIMDTLKQNKLDDNTILVFTSDHGEMMGAHGRIQKLCFYEEASRIPLLIRWPEKINGAAKNDACVSTPDMAPTLLGLLGLDIPEEMEGMDLSHCVLGQGGAEPEFAFLQGMGHTFQWENGFEWRSVRDKHYTYARYHIDGSEHLYDNSNDPYQMNNLVERVDYEDQLVKMRKQMADKMKELNDEFREFTFYRDNWFAKDDPYSIVANAYGPFNQTFDRIVSKRKDKESF